MYTVAGTRYAWTGELLLPVKLANSFVITVIIYKLKFNYQQYLNFFSFIHVDIYFKRSIYNYILFHSVILQYKLIIANNHSHFHDSLTEYKTMYNNSNFFVLFFSVSQILSFSYFYIIFLVPQFLFSFYFQFLNFSLNFSFFFVLFLFFMEIESVGSFCLSCFSSNPFKNLTLLYPPVVFTVLFKFLNFV